MKQTNLNPEMPCSGRLVALGLLFGLAMSLLWSVAGPTPLGHAVAWAIAIVASVRLWRTLGAA